METASAPFSAFIVDDEPYIVEGMVRTYDWAGAGFAVCGWAYSGEEALKKLDALRPDVLFVDVRMQNMDGLELIRRVRERLPECLFVVVSAHKEFEYAQTACALGVSAYLVKIFSDAEFFAVLARLRALLEERAGVPADEAPIEPDLAEMLSIVERNLGDSGFLLANMAREMHFHPGYLGRVFKNRLGKSFHEYLIARRIETSRRLLREDAKISITEITARCGFASAAYFASVFKKAVGMTPREYRARRLSGR